MYKCNSEYHIETQQIVNHFSKLQMGIHAINLKKKMVKRNANKISTLYKGTELSNQSWVFSIVYSQQRRNDRPGFVWL